MTQYLTERERILIERGRIHEQRERDELIDNCYRAGVLKSFTKETTDSLSTSALRKMYDARLEELFGKQ